MILLHLDAETNGLDPATGYLLEVAWTITDEHLDGDMPIRSHVIRYGDDDRLRARDRAVPYVQKMHDESGLWGALFGDTERVDAIQSAILFDLDEWTTEHGLAEDVEVRLAGASVYFDLLWLRQFMPSLAERLSHRTYDLTTLGTLFGRDLGIDVTVQNALPHRARYDVVAQLAEARAYRTLALELTRLPWINRMGQLAGGIAALETTIEALKVNLDPRQHVTVGGVIRSLSESARNLRDQRDLLILEMD